MYCSKCGNELKPNDIFCSKCGTNLKNTQINNVTTSNTTTVNQKKKTKITGIGPGIALILFIAIIGFMINATTKNTSNNYSQLKSTGINSEEITNILDIIDQCGFSNYTIEKDSSLDELDGKRNYWLQNK